MRMVWDPKGQNGGWKQCWFQSVCMIEAQKPDEGNVLYGCRSKPTDLVHFDCNPVCQTVVREVSDVFFSLVGLEIVGKPRTI